MFASSLLIIYFITFIGFVISNFGRNIYFLFKITKYTKIKVKIITICKTEMRK